MQAMQRNAGDKYSISCRLLRRLSTWPLAKLLLPCVRASRARSRPNSPSIASSYLVFAICMHAEVRASQEHMHAPAGSEHGYLGY